MSKAPPIGLMFSICFTCCHCAILALDRRSGICVELENNQDIRTYVRHELGHTESQLGDMIVDRAQGIFQWAFLVGKKVSQLKRDGNGLRKIKTEIQQTPSDLDKLYRELLE